MLLIKNAKKFQQQKCHGNVSKFISDVSKHYLVFHSLKKISQWYAQTFFCLDITIINKNTFFKDLERVFALLSFGRHEKIK